MLQVVSLGHKCPKVLLLVNNVGVVPTELNVAPLDFFVSSLDAEELLHHRPRDILSPGNILSPEFRENILPCFTEKMELVAELVVRDFLPVN